MKKNILIRELSILIFLLGCIFIFFPQKTYAARGGGFGALKVHTRAKFPSGWEQAYGDVVVNVSGGSGSGFNGKCGPSGKRYVCTKSCQTESVVRDIIGKLTEYFGSYAKATRWDNNAWAVFSEDNIYFAACKCTFKIDLWLPAPPSGFEWENYAEVYYSSNEGVMIGSWSPGRPFETDKWGNDNTREYTFKIKLKQTAWDNLGVSLSAKPTSGEIDAYTPLKIDFTANPKHDRGPDFHGIARYDWDFNGDGVYEFNSGNKNTASYSYDWSYLNSGALANKNINAKVKVTCEKGKTAEASVALNLIRAPHQIKCVSLTPIPMRGIVPLDILFTADIYDTWGYPILEYQWNFNSDTPPNTWNRTTTGPNAKITNYTYTQRGDYKAWVRGHSGKPGVPYSDSCPAKATVKARLWSDTDSGEVAP